MMLLFGPTRSPLGVRQVFLTIAAVVAILAIGVDVAQWLRGAPLWVDEEMIALNLRDRTFSELSGPLWLDQAAPLGWMFVERAAILTFGTCELSLRLPPLRHRHDRGRIVGGRPVAQSSLDDAARRAGVHRPVDVAVPLRGEALFGRRILRLPLARTCSVGCRS